MAEKTNTGPGIELHPAQHQPVLLNEVLDLLHVGPNENYVDGTVGLGGHAQAILEASSPGGRILGIDRDDQALEISRERLPPERTVLNHGTFDHVREYLKDHGWSPPDGMLLDLGVSSLQLDQGTRGFSFKKSSALDMRMDLEEEVTARELLHDLPEKSLATIFRDFGEEKFSKRIARQIVRNRRIQPIETTQELCNLVSRAVPFFKKQRIHPATRVFQALRIAVNRELEILNKFLNQAPTFLKPGGVLAILTYHSLEDRIVKHSFREFEECKVLTKKPIRPSTQEIRQNPRARSAKLRAVQLKT